MVASLKHEGRAHRSWAPARACAWALATWAALAACAARHTPLVRPPFDSPRDGVFNAPLPAVETPSDDMQPSLAPGTGLLAYVSREEGNLDVFVRPFAGGAPVRLTTHSADDTSPVFAPDGARLAWVSQSDDVKGDVWVMDADGGHKRRLTGRETTDGRPAWSADGRTLYFTTSGEDGEDRIDAVDVEQATRRLVVERGWDPALSPDGQTLVYVALDEYARPRLYARRLDDGRTAAVTDGAYTDAFPTVAALGSTMTVLFSRFVDDRTGDRVADADDVPSLWAVSIDADLFAGGALPAPRPLTPGEGGEIFVSVARDWLVFTAAGGTDLEIYALPSDGFINQGATIEAVMASARAEADPALRRLALRHIVATAPDQSGPARYELARELAERGKLTDAVDELAKAAQVLGADPMATVARLEAERLKLLAKLEGRWLAREDAQRQLIHDARRVIEELATGAAGDVRVGARTETLRAELDVALGKPRLAAERLEQLVRTTPLPAEDGARGLELLSQLYDRWQDTASTSRLCGDLLTRFAGERAYVAACAERWVSGARSSQGMAPLAALEALAHQQRALPAVASRALLALGHLQVNAGHLDAALGTWRRVASDFPNELLVRADALMTLGEVAEREKKQEAALDAYEQLLAGFPSNAQLRSRARRGLTRIALIKATGEEARGALGEARQSYERLLANDRELVMAHRRYIALSAKLGRLDEVLSRYREEARVSPRDRIARYGYGYALTFQTPPALNEARGELDAVLELDPRFAAAHLTLGWIRMQDSRRDPDRYLEQAAQSFETALGLVDPQQDGGLWAAAQLNLGNALYEFNKTDDAFAAYLARATHTAAFEEPLTELLFSESFARVALREGYLDVALDMAMQAHARARQLKGEPRLGTAAALQAAALLLAEKYSDALDWYQRAEASFRKRNDWARVVPMVRGQALCLQALGRTDEALDRYGSLLELLATGAGPEEPDRPLFSFEVALDAVNATRPTFGFFTKHMEEEIAYAQAARLLRAHGDITLARQHAARQLDLVTRAAADAPAGLRVRRELAQALNESALLALHADDVQGALDLWTKAVEVTTKSAMWPQLAVLADSLAEMAARAPTVRAHGVYTDLAERIAAARLAAAKTDEVTAARLARWLAVDAARRAVSLAPPPAGEQRISSALATLDLAAGSLQEALEHAEVAADPLLLERLRVVAGVDAETVGEEEGAATPTTPPPAPTTASWRTLFDEALATRGAKLEAAEALDPVIAAFRQDAALRWTPERGAFLAVATRSLLARGAVEDAWRLLEQARLQELAPPESRVAATALGSAWEKARATRKTPEARAASLKAAPPLARAFEAAPVELADLRTALDQGSLLQIFSVDAATWHWFVIDARGVRHTATPPLTGAKLPDAVMALLPPPPEGTGRPVLYIDSGELLPNSPAALELATGTLRSRFDVAEALSATYLWAARQGRSLARGTPVLVGSVRAEDGAESIPATEIDVETLRSRASGRLLLALEARPELTTGGLLPPSAAHVVLVMENRRLQLEDLAAARLDGAVAVVEQWPATPRGARLLTQSFLIAGVPSVVVIPGHLDSASRARLIASLRTDGIARALQQQIEAGSIAGDVRLFGHAGMPFDERVDVAFAQLLATAKGAAQAYQQAQGAQSQGAWLVANQELAKLLEVIAFLLQPDSLAALQRSKLKGAAALAQALPTRQLQMQQQLAQTLVALQRYDEAAGLQTQLVAAYEAAAKDDAVLEQLQSLAKTLMAATKNEQAKDALDQCIARAEKKNLPLVVADCRSRMGSVKRALFDYEGARHDYLEAVLAYARAQSENEIYPRRYLGLLYESSLNDYDKALEQYASALPTARKFKLAKMVPALLLDQARVFRLRGDFAQALERVGEAEAALTPELVSERAEASLEAAKIYWYRGNYQRALERQQAALAAARQAGSTFQEIQAVSLEGLIAMNQGELVRAERSITSALDLARGSARRAEEAIQLNNLGIVLQRAGRLDEAVRTFERALAIDGELGSVEGRAFDLRALAVALQRRQDLDGAMRALEEALALSVKIGNRYNEAQCLFAQGELFEARGLTDESGEAYKRAQSKAVAIAIPELEWRSQYALGRIASKAGRHDEARRLFTRALEVAERLGRGRGDATQTHGRDDLYADALDLAVKGGDLAEAFSLSERLRARALLDVVATRTLELRSPRARELVEAEAKSRDAVLVAQRAVALGDRAAGEKLTEATRAHGVALSALTEELPDLARAFTIHPPSLAEVQAALPGDALVISYLLGAETSLALVVSRKGIEAVTLGVNRARAEALARELRAHMQAFAPVDAPAIALADLLLAPLASRMEAAKTLVFVPHLALHHVPFAALPMGEKPLLERWAVAVSPSVASLTSQLSRPARPAPHRVLALAHGDDLPFAALEARSIGTDTYLGPQAELARLMRAGTPGQALAIAAHGELDGRDPLGSAIVLARGPSDDGRLTLREVFGLTSVPPLVTLSACSSAATDASGDEWVSLASAFFAGGAQTVLAAQDRVSDLAAAVLVKRFHRYVTSDGAAEALRKAALLTRRYFPHPAHWSNFVLLGDFR